MGRAQGAVEGVQLPETEKRIVKHKGRSQGSRFLLGRCRGRVDAGAAKTRPSALGMSDPLMEFLEFPEKGKIFWGGGGRF